MIKIMRSWLITLSYPIPPERKALSDSGLGLPEWMHTSNKIINIVL